MDKPDPGRSHEAQSAPPDGADIQRQLTDIQELQQETLALLRQLAALLLPKADPDKPRLEDLIAALVGQQNGMLILLGQIASDTSELLDRLPVRDGAKLNGLHPGNGGVRQ